MTNSLKKNEFLLPIDRFFVRDEADAYAQIPFQSSDSWGDEWAPSLASPTSWGNEAVEIMAEAACKKIPSDIKAVEENTVPSWLWRHQSHSKRKIPTHFESDLRDIFNRAVGSAVAKAWKLNLFSSEKQASVFYNETRFALMQRYIVIAPDVIAPWGLSWAYGLEENKTPAQRNAKSDDISTSLSNAAIDALIGKTKKIDTPVVWKKLFAVKSNELRSVSLRLSDIAADWHSSSTNPARAMIDLMALRHNDGSVHIGAIKQATRLLTILLDLHDRNDVTIGFTNLSPLLMALGLAYDSDAARALAASLAALITAECTLASAEMAALRSPSEAFIADREAVMRALRNHRRAVYGDSNDYEKLSVLPAPLPLKNCPDLALASEAQRGWDEALKRVRIFGLRATQATDLTPSPTLAVLMTSATQGLEPMGRLTCIDQDDDDSRKPILHPAVGEGLMRLGSSRNVTNAAVQHVMGTRTLHKAPHINHVVLRAKGFTQTELEKVETYLSSVDTIRLALTPWVVGLDFCKTILKIPARQLDSTRFDLLAHLGFSNEHIEAANLYCFGHKTARNAKAIHIRHRPLFAYGAEISVEARIRMAAAVQSFISCDTGIKATLPVQQSAEHGAEVTLSAWRHGLKSLTIQFDPSLRNPQVKAKKISTRLIKAVSQPHAKPFPSLSHKTAAGKMSGKGSTAYSSKKLPVGRRVVHKA